MATKNRRHNAGENFIWGRFNVPDSLLKSRWRRMVLQRPQGTLRALFYSVNLDIRLTLSFKNTNRKRRQGAPAGA